MFSVFAGASIGATGVGYAAWRVFWRPTQRVLSGTSELATLYRAEVGKLAIIGGLCAVFFLLSDGLAVSGLVVGLLLSLVVSSQDTASIDNGIGPNKIWQATRSRQRVISNTTCKT